MAVMELPRVELNQRAEGQRRRWAGVHAERGSLRPGIEGLAPREAEVLDSYIRLGLRKLVAAEMEISEHTVRNYITNILQRLGVRSMAQACIIYDRHARGFVRPTWPDVDRRHHERRGKDRRSGHERRGRV